MLCSAVPARCSWRTRTVLDSLPSQRCPCDATSWWLCCRGAMRRLQCLYPLFCMTRDKRHGSPSSSSVSRLKEHRIRQDRRAHIETAELSRGILGGTRGILGLRIGTHQVLSAPTTGISKSWFVMQSKHYLQASSFAKKMLHSFD